LTFQDSAAAHKQQHKRGTESQQHRGHLPRVAETVVAAPAAAVQMEPAAAAAAVAAAVVAAAAAAAVVVVAAAAAVLEVEAVGVVQSEHVAAAAAAAVRRMEPADAAGLAVSSAAENWENKSLEYPRGCFQGKVSPLLETQHAQQRDTGGCSHHPPATNSI
jgi:hypothetical protein